MKKLSLILAFGILLLTASPIFAQNTQLIKKVKTQNAGESSELNVQVEETNTSVISNENDDGETTSQGQAKGQPKIQTLSTNAQEKMSIVSQKVKELLASEDRQGGIGQEIREIARLQNQAQEKIQTQTIKMASRSGLLKKLIGPDLKAVGNLKQELIQNQLRVKKLKELKTEVVNKAEETQVQETVEALIEQNTALENQIDQEEDTPSMFGWLIKLFRKKSTGNVRIAL